MNRWTTPALLAASLGASACGGDDGTSGASILPTSNEDASDESTTDPTGEQEGGLDATAVVNSASVSFACGPEFTGPNVAAYDEELDTYSILCRSSDATSELGISFGSPTAGMVNFELSEHGVSLGAVMAEEPLDSTSPNLVSNLVIFGVIQTGAHVEGTFEAEWDATAGGQIANVSGSFSIDF